MGAACQEKGRLVALDPRLCGWPELVDAMRRAASMEGLRVSVAVDPHRLPVRNHTRWSRLRQEQLWGVRLALEINPKDQSSSFHAPVDRHPLLERSDPVLVTWISSRRRA